MVNGCNCQCDYASTRAAPGQMRKISRAQLLKHLQSRGITPHGDAKARKEKRIAKSRRFSRFWEMPNYVEKWPFFLSSVLLIVPDWTDMIVWPKSGKWPCAANTNEWGERVRDTVLRCFEIPADWDGGLNFEREELAAIVTMLFIIYMFRGIED